MYTKLVQLSIVIIAVCCIFTPDLFLFKIGANFTVQIMLFYFVLALAFLALKDQKSMMISFLSCAALCLFLKETTHPDVLQSFYPRPTAGASLKIAHFNVSTSNENYEKTIKSILASEADLISLQEVTPDWDRKFKEHLTKTYPYQHTIVRIDPFGLAVYSKYPFKSIKTFHFEDIPNISGSISIDSSGREICFISSHTAPLFSSNAYKKLKEHLNQIARHAKTLQKEKGPVITFGDYSTVTWSPEIKRFRNESNLLDSRRDFMPTFSSGLPFLQIPIDHIFYSRDLNCTSFKTVDGAASNQLGIVGTYQFKLKKKKHTQIGHQVKSKHQTYDLETYQ